MKQYAWLILAVAGVFETGWAVGLKYTQGFTRLGWSIVTGVMIVISMGLLGVARGVCHRARPMQCGPESVRWARWRWESCCLGNQRQLRDWRALG